MIRRVDPGGGEAQRSRSGSFTVHTLTSRPRSCACVASGAGVGPATDRRSGCSAEWPCASATSSASSGSLAPGEQCGADVGGERSDPVDAREVERRDQHPVAAARARRGGSTSSCGHAVRRDPRPRSGEVLDLDVHEPARARVERLAERRHLGEGGPHVGQRQLRQQARWAWRRRGAPRARRRWCGWTSSSTPSAPSSTARAKAGTVFSGARRLAPR